MTRRLFCDKLKILSLYITDTNVLFLTHKITQDMVFKTRQLYSWLVLAISLLIICLWTYWGINEAFHEGWYYESVWSNLSLTFFQYLSLPIIFLTLSLLSLTYKRMGAALFLGLGICALFFFDSPAGRFLIFLPLLFLAGGFYGGEFKHRKQTVIVFMTSFIFIILVWGLPQLIRVQNRFNDKNFTARIVDGNGVKLIWAPRGPGFPAKGTNWQTAMDNCAKLDKSGVVLQDTQVHIWRLPTKDEIIRSLTRDNKNVLGMINEEGRAEYQTQPDKETPLWDPYSPIIYYWTSDLKNEQSAYLVAYNGYMLNRQKNSGADYQGYRCVKNE